MEYILENGAVYLVERIGNSTVKTLASDMYYDDTSGEFKKKTLSENNIPNMQQLAVDAIMAGMIDMQTQQANGLDALMAGMSDLYAQNEALKAEIEALKKQTGGTA
jgi:hypothetical protein